jgi:hypothetical protein
MIGKSCFPEDRYPIDGGKLQYAKISILEWEREGDIKAVGPQGGEV